MEPVSLVIQYGMVGGSAPDHTTNGESFTNTTTGDRYPSASRNRKSQSSRQAPEIFALTNAIHLPSYAV